MLILPPKPGGKAALSQSLASSIPQMADAFQEYAQRKKAEYKQAQTNQALKKAGFEQLVGLPEHMQKLLAPEIFREQQYQKEFGEPEPRQMGFQGAAPRGIEGATPFMQGEQPLTNNAQFERKPIIDFEAYKNLSPERKVRFAQARPEFAKRYDKLIAEENRTKGAKTLSPDLAETAADIIENNPEDSPEQLGNKLTRAGIPSANVKDYVNNRRLQQESKTKQETRTATRFDKYVDELRDAHRQAQNQIDAIKDIRKVTDAASAPNSLVNWARSFGDKGKRLSDSLLTAAQGEFNAALPGLIEGFRQLFGVRITDADLAILQDKLPNFGKTAEANHAILNILEKGARKMGKRYEIANELRRENKNVFPEDFDILVEEKYMDWKAHENANSWNQDKPPAKGYVNVFNNEGDLLGQIPRDRSEAYKKQHPNDIIL